MIKSFALPSHQSKFEKKKRLKSEFIDNEDDDDEEEDDENSSKTIEAMKNMAKHINFSRMKLNSCLKLK